MTRRASLSYLLIAIAAGCARHSPTGDATATPSQSVVVYTSVDDVFAEPICRQFESETGIHVQLVTDTEETKSTGLLNRLLAERERPQADVFWSGDPVRAAILKQRGVSAPYASPAAAGLPTGYSDAAHHWTCFSARARVIIYNRRLVAEKDKPTSIDALAAPRFRNRACIANPLFGTTGMHAAALFQVLGESKARDFFQSLVANGVKIVSSNGEVRRRVSNGEFAIGLTDTDDVNVAIQEGKPVGFVYPDQDGIGTLLIPNAVVLIANGPHPQNARRLIDYLLRPATEAALARSEAAQIPLRADVELPARFPFRPVGGFHVMTVDYAALAPALQRLSRGFLKEWVDRNR